MIEKLLYLLTIEIKNNISCQLTKNLSVILHIYVRFPPLTTTAFLCNVEKLRRAFEIVPLFLIISGIQCVINLLYTDSKWSFTFLEWLELVVKESYIWTTM